MLFIFTTPGNSGDAVFSINGTVDAAGRLTGTYSSDEGKHYGTFTGTVSGNNFQLTFNGFVANETCRDSGTFTATKGGDAAKPVLDYLVSVGAK